MLHCYVCGALSQCMNVNYLDIARIEVQSLHGIVESMPVVAQPELRLCPIPQDCGLELCTACLLKQLCRLVVFFQGLLDEELLIQLYASYEQVIALDLQCQQMATFSATQC